MDQAIICTVFHYVSNISEQEVEEDLLGIQRSGPSFLETSCDGISARRNDTLKIVLPVWRQRWTLYQQY